MVSTSIQRLIYKIIFKKTKSNKKMKKMKKTLSFYYLFLYIKQNQEKDRCDPSDKIGKNLMFFNLVIADGSCYRT